MNTCRKETLLLCTPPKSSSSQPFTTFHTHTGPAPRPMAISEGKGSETGLGLWEDSESHAQGRCEA